jgi:hypothetical protein
LSKPGTITVKAGCARRPTGTGQRRPGARTREASLDRARARFKLAPVGRMARDRTLPLHLLHHEVTPADLAGVTVSMRVMPAVDGYECLRQPVAAGDGTGGQVASIAVVSGTCCSSHPEQVPITFVAPTASRISSRLSSPLQEPPPRRPGRVLVLRSPGGRAELFAGAGRHYPLPSESDR